MNIFTHRFISQKVRKYIQEELGIKLDKNSFEYGSIKPDIVPRLRNIKHFSEDSIDFICDSIIDLKSKPFSDSRTFIKYFSVQLGVITHYISDYFCFAHNDPSLIDNLYKHLIYENRVGMATIDYKTDIHYIKDRYEQLMHNNCKDMIYTMLSEYKSEGSSTPKMDLRYAITVSSLVSVNIINRCIENLINAVA